MTYTFKHKTNEIDITFEVTADGAHKVVESFVYFMKAVSFHDNSIKSALETAAEDIE